jgi:hypothetical protein
VIEMNKDIIKERLEKLGFIILETTHEFIIARFGYEAFFRIYIMNEGKPGYEQLVVTAYEHNSNSKLGRVVEGIVSGFTGD